MDDQSGFTLVEVIVSVLLLGFVAFAAILFLFSGVSGYVFSKQASALSQKANLVLARITKELSGEMLKIESTTPSSVKYVYQYNPVQKKRYIALVGAGTRREVEIAVGDDPPTPEETDVEGVLIDQVSDFKLEFKKYDNSSSQWVDWVVGSDEMDSLGRINITLKLFVNSYDDDTVDFITTVNPVGHDYIIG